jgi:N-acetyl-1-D-myo-inositol-2-amino-2-deoxy-alpha-D-glucopyranoside deacetylase
MKNTIEELDEPPRTSSGTAPDLRLMCVLAHPDDESLGMGGTLAQCAADGVSTFLVTATRGERGRFGEGGQSPGPDIVGRVREAELLAAARELGVKDVRFLDYPDGTLDQVDPAAVLPRVEREALERLSGGAPPARDQRGR